MSYDDQTFTILTTCIPEQIIADYRAAAEIRRPRVVTTHMLVDAYIGFRRNHCALESAAIHAGSQGGPWGGFATMAPVREALNSRIGRRADQVSRAGMAPEGFFRQLRGYG